MSFGSAPTRSRSSGKGSKEKKAPKRKKQEFHTTKKRAAKEEKPDLGGIKERAVSALEHLGQQKFSAEPGGYNVQGWLKSFTLLLEDFDSKVSPLPEEYHAKKAAILQQFSKPLDNSEVEARIQVLRKEETEIKTKLDRESQRITNRAVEVRNESERQTKAVQDEQAKLDQLNLERQQASFFSKLLGRGPTTKPVEDKIAELKALLASLEAEMATLQGARESMERRPGSGGDPYGGDWKRLGEIAEEIGRLEAGMSERMQRAKEREDAAAEMITIIKGIPTEVSEEKA